MLLLILTGLIEWTFIKATWVGQSKADCEEGGACCAVITARWDQIIYGFYPKLQRWPVNVAFSLQLLASTMLFCLGIKLHYRILSYLFIQCLILYFLHGGGILPIVPTSLWGGFFLTIFLAFGSMFCSFPIAIILALGRNSTLVIFKPLCIAFIELVRGVLLISILHFAAIMFPLFVSSDLVIDNLWCVFVGITLFQAVFSTCLGEEDEAKRC